LWRVARLRIKKTKNARMEQRGLLDCQIPSNLDKKVIIENLKIYVYLNPKKCLIIR